MPALDPWPADPTAPVEDLLPVQEAPPPLSQELEALLPVQEVKQEAFDAWMPGQTWFAWNSVSSTTVTMGDQAWVSWNNNVTTSAGSMAYNYSTNTVYVSSGATWTAWNVGYTEETEEEAAEREAARVAQNARWAAEKAKRRAAKARAEELLLIMLGDAQRETYLGKGWFEVRGSKGGRWRIRNRGQSGNVDLMPEIGEERLATYCAHPPDVPDADAHIAQMLALVTDEDAFTRVANVHYRRPREAARAA